MDDGEQVVDVDDLADELDEVAPLELPATGSGGGGFDTGRETELIAPAWDDQPQAGAEIDAGPEVTADGADGTVRDGHDEVPAAESDEEAPLGARVAIEHGRRGGRLVIRYNSLDELDGILAHIR